ncbi:MAG: HNH endonuclease signature motif containing protein [Propionicimonas sp.]
MLAEESACHLCGEPVDKTLTMDWRKHGRRCKGDGCPGCVPHPMRAEVDHITPIAKGGDPYDRANAALSHRRCNRAKGAGPKPEPMAPDAFPLSDCWGGIFDSLSAG